MRGKLSGNLSGKTRDGAAVEESLRRRKFHGRSLCTAQSLARTREINPPSVPLIEIASRAMKKKKEKTIPRIPYTASDSLYIERSREASSSRRRGSSLRKIGHDLLQPIKISRSNARVSTYHPVPTNRA